MCPAPASTGVCSVVSPGPFTWKGGSQLGSPCLWSKHFTHWCISSASTLLFDTGSPTGPGACWLTSLSGSLAPGIFWFPPCQLWDYKQALLHLCSSLVSVGFLLVQEALEGLGHLPNLFLLHFLTVTNVEGSIEFHPRRKEEWHFEVTHRWPPHQKLQLSWSEVSCSRTTPRSPGTYEERYRSWKSTGCLRMCAGFVNTFVTRKEWSLWLAWSETGRWMCKRQGKGRRCIYQTLIKQQKL